METHPPDLGQEKEPATMTHPQWNAHIHFPSFLGFDAGALRNF